ncbi:UBX domain protein, putative [Talaromyces stipitatus ATCC 10500]|uniref:UBX domain protein, putative n=1 Tax=Talaromyces stipitatus (strain ATCC 10500 / CBS 375.48 / QM 6759 / NRRL 1006) TaxID=441959 RepID=B8MKC1_TALSN|nr:UBX domain protein, putative [Talaromyces stipitatus ATCC 10500]EED15276.1 UBX domain protein, putative [Talaromyces stipitatus ATCC 10500]
MSSHVVVIDSTARRATIKTAPSKPLADVLQEACTKLGLNASQYGLKHQSKQLDLSLLFRLSGLSSGAKLELVQLSKSPSVVTVALQLPESESQGVPNGRLLDKFPSTTTLWLVLRKFEAGVAGNGSTRNLTARAAPATDSGNNGTGRLYYQTPVLQVMGRELAEFSDLQKSLAQLGFNSGNVLFRLSFRTTQQPFEEAVAMIDKYFEAHGEKAKVSSTAETITAATGLNEPAQLLEPAATTGLTEAEPMDTQEDITQPAAGVPVSDPQRTEAVAPPLVSDRPVTVYKPPTNTTPHSALTSYNEEDYVPSIEHAKSHQGRLNQLSRNVRLPSDKEIAEKEAAEQEKLAAITEIDVKIRFPEQSQVVAKFKQTDTGSHLYSFVRGCLNPTFANEKFQLVVFGAAVKQSRTGPGGSSQAIPDSDQQYLIKDQGLRGRVLVNFTWIDNKQASAMTAATRMTSLLKPELSRQAQDIQIPSVPGVVEGDNKDKPSLINRLGTKGEGEGGSQSHGPKKGGVPKWLKLPGKK